MRERGCTRRATVVYQGQPRKFHGLNGNVSGAAKTQSVSTLKQAAFELCVRSMAIWICGSKMFGKLVSLSRPRRRSVSISTHSQTSHSSLTTPWILWARSSDNVSSSGQYQPGHLCNCWSCFERRTEGAEQSPSYTPRIASPCVWFQHTTVNGMSSLLVSGTLRSKVTQLSEHMLHGLQVSDPQ